MTDWIVIAVIAAILGLAGWYVCRARKKGITCVGCPDSKTCSGRCPGCAKGK